jgi:DNA-binding NarL/FixJ family response regulator
MPVINGFELQKQIQANDKLKERCIPYLFFSTNANREAVSEAYALSAQGFFVKPNSVSHLHKKMRKILEYWYESFSPNQYLERANE